MDNFSSILQHVTKYIVILFSNHPDVPNSGTFICVDNPAHIDLFCTYLYLLDLCYIAL